MDHRPQAWGRPRDDVYGAYDPSYLQNSGPKQTTQSPIVTGTSVVAVKFKDGVVIAADNLASYGSLARFTQVPRLRTFGGTSVLGFGGDVSDMQYLDRHLTLLSIDEAYTNPPTSADDDDNDNDSSAAGPGGSLNAANLHKYITKLLYGRRTKFDPLWNQVLVAGLDGAGKPYLGSADLRGTSFTAPSLATGMGSMLALPVLRGAAGSDEDALKLDRDAAVALVRECMKLLFYRDARSLDRYSLAVVTAAGVDISEDERLEKQSWAFAERIRGYGTQTV